MGAEVNEARPNASTNNPVTNAARDALRTIACLLTNGRILPPPLEVVSGFSRTFSRTLHGPVRREDRPEFGQRRDAARRFDPACRPRRGRRGMMGVDHRI